MSELQQEQVRKLIQQFRDGSLGRRDFLRQVVALGIGTAVTYSLLGQAESKAQGLGVPSTKALGEEGNPVVGDFPKPTTLMVGEEDVHQPPRLSTYAVGEEEPHHGALPTTERVGEEDLHQPPASTYAVGEEDVPQPPQVTTQALGEEDLRGGQPTTAMEGEEGTQILPPQPSTRALGEEGNVAPPKMSTTAFGEEDNVVPVCPQQRPLRRRWNGWNRW